jgi:light-regulated signal transduction histidine kinase (bacteriophytochrome)
METVREMRHQPTAKSRPDDGARIQSGGYLLELSLDWIVLRASENIHHLLGESHVTLIDEPLGRFVQAQALHDLRNLFSRLSGTTGIARAYGVRLTDERDRDLHDIAFQIVAGRVLLEAVPSASDSFGQAFGTIGGLIEGLGDGRGEALLEGGTRRMRALTGYDRVTLFLGDRRAESSRGAYAAAAELLADLPILVADTEAEPIGMFPRRADDRSIDAALMKVGDLQGLRDAGVRSLMRVEFVGGEFRCDHRRPREPNLEVHAAAELFAQLFAMRLEIDRLRG